MGEYLGISINEFAPVAVRREFRAEEASPDFVATVTETFPVELGAGSVTVFHAAEPVLPAAETPMILASASRPDFWQQANSFIKRHKPELAVGASAGAIVACSLPEWTKPVANLISTLWSVAPVGFCLLSGGLIIAFAYGRAKWGGEAPAPRKISLRIDDKKHKEF